MTSLYEIYYGHPVWKGPPTQTIINIIKSLTITDESGRRYYRMDIWKPWQRLRSPYDFERLNAAIDRRRS